MSERSAYSPIATKTINVDSDYSPSHMFYSYDNNVVPTRNSVDVQVEVVIQAITEISEISASFTTDFMFIQIWHDPRLSYSEITNFLQKIKLSHGAIDRVWLPNVCFVNSKSSFVHQSRTPNIFLLIFPNGKVWVSIMCDRRSTRVLYQ